MVPLFLKSQVAQAVGSSSCIGLYVGVETYFLCIARCNGLRFALRTCRPPATGQWFAWLCLPRAVQIPDICAKNAEVEVALVEEIRKFPINLYFIIFGSG